MRHNLSQYGHKDLNGSSKLVENSKMSLISVLYYVQRKRKRKFSQ